MSRKLKIALPSDAEARAALWLPGEEGDDSKRGAVVVYDDPLMEATGAEHARPLMDDLIAALLDLDLAVAMLESPLVGKSPASIGAKLFSGAMHRELLQATAGHVEISAERVGMLGRSIGALAAVPAAFDCAVQRLCLLSPASPAAALRLCEETEREHELGAAIEGAAALELIARFEVPVLIAHGAADRRVPPESSLAYVEALELAGRRVEHVLVAWGDHEFLHPAARAACISAITGFMAELTLPVAAAAST